MTRVSGFRDLAVYVYESSLKSWELYLIAASLKIPLKVQMFPLEPTRFGSGAVVESDEVKFSPEFEQDIKSVEVFFTKYFPSESLEEIFENLSYGIMKMYLPLLNRSELLLKKPISNSQKKVASVIRDLERLKKSMTEVISDPTLQLVSNITGIKSIDQLQKISNLMDEAVDQKLGPKRAGGVSTGLKRLDSNIAKLVYTPSYDDNFEVGVLWLYKVIDKYLADLKLKPSIAEMPFKDAAMREISGPKSDRDKHLRIALVYQIVKLYNVKESCQFNTISRIVKKLNTRYYGGLKKINRPEIKFDQFESMKTEKFIFSYLLKNKILSEVSRACVEVFPLLSKNPSLNFDQFIVYKRKFQKILEAEILRVKLISSFDGRFKGISKMRFQAMFKIEDLHFIPLTQISHSKIKSR